MSPSFLVLGVTTAKLGLLTTAAVGMVAALAPWLTARANRRHDEKMARD